MGRNKRHGINAIKRIIKRPDPPDSLTEIARELEFTRTGPLMKLLNEPTIEAPKGYDLIFVPKLIIRGASHGNTPD